MTVADIDDGKDDDGASDGGGNSKSSERRCRRSDWSDSDEVCEGLTSELPKSDADEADDDDGDEFEADETDEATFLPCAEPAASDVGVAVAVAVAVGVDEVATADTTGEDAGTA